MSVNIGGHDFEGPYDEPEEIKEELGVYVVLCLVEGEPHCVLDIGISEGGMAPTRRDPSARAPTRKGNLRHRVKYHGRKDCWKANTHGTVGYAVRYMPYSQELIDLERELQWKFDFACGENYWKRVELEWKEYQEFKSKIGPRGSVRL